MTDNEQGYTPTEAEALAGFRLALMENGATELEATAAWNRWLAAHDAATLAAHRVTLVADSREALATGLDESAQWEDPSDPYDAADALLASGVVQVTTPTQTDEGCPAISPSDASCIVRAGIWHETHITRDSTTWRDYAGKVRGLTHEQIASRPAPVAPPAEEWEDPHPYDFGKGHGRGAVAQPYESGPVGALAPRTREQYAADQQPVVPVDALGFPTQVGATFRARFAGDPEHYDRHEFVITPGYIKATGMGLLYPRPELDPASIEDVRPADGRNGARE